MLHEARKQLKDHGFAALGPVLETERASRLARAFTDHLGTSPQGNDYGLLRNDVWRELPAFGEELLDGRLGRLACELLGTEEVTLFQDNVILKPAQHHAKVCWHQDFSYWPLDRPQGITLWVALSAVTELNGCLHFVPGTHLGGERRASDFMPGTDQPGNADLEPLELRSEHLEVPVPLGPGEIVAHHPLTWHMSPGNFSAQARCGWSLTFLHPKTRWAPSHAPHPLNYSLKPEENSALCPIHFPRIQARA
jgi:ectoine hydroxylase-related dioxygenase (phytanoyl-CoA dioxygenase family)